MVLVSEHPDFQSGRGWEAGRAGQPCVHLADVFGLWGVGGQRIIRPLACVPGLRHEPASGSQCRPQHPATRTRTACGRAGRSGANVADCRKRSLRISRFQAGECQQPNIAGSASRQHTWPMWGRCMHRPASPYINLTIHGALSRHRFRRIPHCIRRLPMNSAQRRIEHTQKAEEIGNWSPGTCHLHTQHEAGRFPIWPRSLTFRRVGQPALWLPSPRRERGWG